MKVLTLLSCLVATSVVTLAQRQDDLFPIQGFAIAAPRPSGVDRFIKFIHEELAPRKVNTLILRVDYNFQYESYPLLRDSSALSKKDVQKLINACRQDAIKIIPQVNLLGHQSWAIKTNKLLINFPEFDETPHIKMPEKYNWPNADSLYCKSYCPLHPTIHQVVFALIDELLDAFQADAFHAGMDEVFYLGNDKCPRCSGQDKAVLFADEVRRIRDHLALKNRDLWIWGDRLIDGKATGLGMWEASYNNTHRAIDLIPKDVLICDWHYERPDQTAAYFAIKGFRVVTCPWRNPAVAEVQVEDMARFRKNSTREMKNRFSGMVQTVWSDPDSFIDGFYDLNQKKPSPDVVNSNQTPWTTFRATYKKIADLKSGK